MVKGSGDCEIFHKEREVGQKSTFRHSLLLKDKYAGWQLPDGERKRKFTPAAGSKWWHVPGVGAAPENRAGQPPQTLRKETVDPGGASAMAGA